MTNTNHGLYQPASAPALGVWDAGTEDYKAPAAKLTAGVTSGYWSDDAKGAWLYDGANFWTYDDPKTVCSLTCRSPLL